MTTNPYMKLHAERIKQAAANPDANRYTGVPGSTIPTLGERQVQLHTERKDLEDNLSNWQGEKIEELDYQLQQAVGKGVITHAEYDQIHTQMTVTAPTKDRTFWDEMMGLERSSEDMLGTWFQPIIDTLSVPLYAANAMTYANLGSSWEDGNALEIGPVKIGFSTSAFKKSWSERRTFGYVAQNEFDLHWGVGLFADIALDPVTWMTFGIGAGTKVSLSAGQKLGKATLAFSAVKPLNRHGSDIYKIASRELGPKVEQRFGLPDIRKAAVKGGEDLADVARVEAKALLQIDKEIGDYMVTNYDKLNAQLVKNQKRTMLGSSKLATVAFPIRYPGTKLIEGTSALFKHPFQRTAGDMFQDTATFMNKQRGLTAAPGTAAAVVIGGGIIGGLANPLGDSAAYIGGALGGALGYRLAGSAYGEWAGKSFSRTGRVAGDIKRAWFRTDNLMKSHVDQRFDEINTRFKDISEDDRHTISYMLEANDAAFVKRDPINGRIISAQMQNGHVSQETVDLANWTMGRFLKILESEQKNFRIDSVNNYVSHMYKDPSVRRIVQMKVDAHQGISNGSAKGATLGPQSFEYHRTIATIEDLMEHVGTGKIETDIVKILARREGAHAKLIFREAFYDYLRETAGLPAVMTFQAAQNGKVAAKYLKQLLNSQNPAKDRALANSDQYYSAKDSQAQKLGFNINDSDSLAVKSQVSKDNLELAEHLTLDFAAKQASVKKYNGNVAAANQTSRTFKQGTGAAGHDVDAIDILKAIQDGEDALDVIRWQLKKPAADGADKWAPSNWADLKGFVKNLDKWSRKNYEAPLDVAFPSFKANLEQSMISGSRFGWNKKAKWRQQEEKQWNNLWKGINEKEVVTKGWEPQLPKEVAERAAAWRMRTGDYTDSFRAKPRQLKDIQLIAGKLGLSPGHIQSISEALTGKAHIGKLSQRDASRLIDYMAYHTKSEVSRVGGKTAVQIRNNLFGEKIVQATFSNRAKPFFGDIDGLLKTRKHEETELIADAERRVMGAEAAEDIARSKRIAANLRTSLNDWSGKRTKTKKQAQRKAEAIASLRTKLDELSDEIDSSEASFRAASKEADTPAKQTATRDYIGREEFMKINEEVMSVAEKAMYGKRHAFTRKSHNINSFAGRESKRLHKLRRQTEQSIRSLEKNAKDLKGGQTKAKEALSSYMKDNKDALADFASKKGRSGKASKTAEAGRVKLLEDLNKSNLKLDKAKKALSDKIKKTRNTSKVELIGNGKYRVKEAAQASRVVAAEHTLEGVAYKSRAARVSEMRKELLEEYTEIEIKELAKKDSGIFYGWENLKPIRVSIDEIDITGVGKDAKLERAKEFISKGEPVEPPLVFLKKDGTLGVTDGRHRIAALKAAGKKEIVVDIESSAIGKLKATKEPGKIYDIMTFNQGRKVKFVGKHAEEIEKALIADFVVNGKRTLDSFQPIKSGELPSEYLGAASRTFYFPKSIADLLDDIQTPLYNNKSDAVNRMLRGYDSIISTWKIPLLAPWGSTWMRNGIGNVAQGMIRSGLGLMDTATSGDFFKLYGYALAKGSPKLKKTFRVSDDALNRLGKQKVKAVGDDHRHAGSLTVEELYDEMGQRGVLSGMWYAEIEEGLSTRLGSRAAGAMMGGGIGASIGGLPGAGVGAVIGGLMGNRAARMKGLFKVGELASELPTRMMLGLTTYKKSGSLLDMGDDVRHYLHDYTDLTQLERRFMRRAIPFYNFVKMASRVIGNGLYQNPGMTILPHKIFNNQNMRTFDLDKDGVYDPGVDDPVMPEDYPDFWHGHLKFLGKEMDDDGNVQTWVKAGINPPLQEVGHLLDIVMPGGKDIKALGSRGAFFPTSILEHMSNFDTFTLSRIAPEKPGEKTRFTRGRPFRNSPQWMKNFVEYEKHEDGSETVDPRFAWLLGELPTSRFVNISKQIYDSDSPGELNYNALSKAVLAWSTYRYDEETQTYFQNNAKIEAMENVLMNVGLLKKYERNMYMNPDGTPDWGGKKANKSKTKKTEAEIRDEVRKRMGLSPTQQE